MSIMLLGDTHHGGVRAAIQAYIEVCGDFCARMHDPDSEDPFDVREFAGLMAEHKVFGVLCQLNDECFARRYGGTLRYQGPTPSLLQFDLKSVWSPDDYLFMAFQGLRCMDYQLETGWITDYDADDLYVELNGPDNVQKAPRELRDYEEYAIGFMRMLIDWCAREIARRALEKSRFGSEGHLSAWPLGTDIINTNAPKSTKR